MLDERGVLKKELTFDGLHPNDAGYELIGPLAERLSRRLLRADLHEFSGGTDHRLPWSVVRERGLSDRRQKTIVCPTLVIGL